jgi:hypothetical protein
MKISCIVFGIFLLLSGYSGLRLAQNGSEANKMYGPECAESGNIEGTQPYADCVSQIWQLAKELEHARQQVKGMLLLIREKERQKPGKI